MRAFLTSNIVGLAGFFKRYTDSLTGEVERAYIRESESFFPTIKMENGLWSEAANDRECEI